MNLICLGLYNARKRGIMHPSELSSPPLNLKVKGTRTIMTYYRNGMLKSIRRI